MRICMRDVVIPYAQMPYEIIKPPSKGWIGHGSATDQMVNLCGELACAGLPRPKHGVVAPDLPGISANAGENGPRPVRRPTNPGMLAPKNGRAVAPNLGDDSGRHEDLWNHREHRDH